MQSEDHCAMSLKILFRALDSFECELQASPPSVFGVHDDVVRAPIDAGRALSPTISSQHSLVLNKSTLFFLPPSQLSLHPQAPRGTCPTRPFAARADCTGKPNTAADLSICLLRRSCGAPEIPASFCYVDIHLVLLLLLSHNQQHFPSSIGYAWSLLLILPPSLYIYTIMIPDPCRTRAGQPQTSSSNAD
jgi:hypothetical protein